jgi:hypothetical protein
MSALIGFRLTARSSGPGCAGSDRGRLGAMRSRTAVLMIAIGVGVLLTVVLTSTGYYAYVSGAENVARVLFWPNTLLQGLISCNEIGTSE